MQNSKFAARLLAVAVLSCFSIASAEAYALRTVQAGDSVGLIADRYGISVDAILSANDLTTSLIYPGQVLKIPYIEAVGGPTDAGTRTPPGFMWHTLREGQTLSSVASSYGLSVNAIVGANPDISSLDRLPIGFELLIPPSAGMVVRFGAGDNILGILEENGIEPADFARANGLRSPFDLVPDMLLFLPGVQPTEALARLQQVREEENRYIWPLHGRLTSYFGPRNLGMGTSSFHRGLDIAAPTGTPVGAARSGTVSFAGWSTQGYGNLVRIRHTDGSETWYGHFSSISVSVGQYVSQGAIVGRVGSTGISTGPHLHFEVHERGTPVDPLSILR